MKTKEVKREEANARNYAYKQLSPKERLTGAFERGHSGSKEVKRLKKDLAKAGETNNEQPRIRDAG